jgi:hypothetical protein
VRLGVVQQRRQLGQGLLAAELAQEEHGRPADGSVRRLAQALDRLAALGTESNQDVDEVLSGPAPFLS